MGNSFAYSQIGGTLGKDPESRSTPNGVKVVNFSIAVEKGYKDNARTEWYNVVAFEKNAEFAEKYLKKGKGARISGELQTRSYDDKQTGQKKYITEIVAWNIGFMDSGFSKSESKPARSESAPQTRAVAVQETRPSTPANDDPFGEEDPF